MKFSKTMRKLLAYVCSFVMVVSCMAGYRTNVSADEVEGTIPEGYRLLTEEKWHPLGETTDTTIGDDNQPASEWNVYVGISWAGVSAAVKDGADGQDTVSIYVASASTQAWGLQLGRVFKGLEPGETYAYQIDYTVDQTNAKWIGIVTADEKGEAKVIKALDSVVGDNQTFTVTGTKVFSPEDTEYTRYLSWLETDRNLAYKQSATVSTYREGSTDYGVLTDGICDSWSNYVGATTPGYFEVDLGQEYAASSIDQVVVWFRNGDANLYPTDGYKIQFGNLVFDTVAEVKDYPEGKDTTQTDGAQYMVATNIDKTNLTGNVRKVRIQVDQSVGWGTQIAEIAVFSENPQDPVPVDPVDEPAGVAVSSEQSKTILGDIKFTIEAGENQEDYTYAVFLDDSTITSLTNCVAGTEYTISGVQSGKHTIKVVSCYNGGVSEGIVSNEVEVKTIIDDVKDYSKNFAYNKSFTLSSGSSAEGTGSITDGIISSSDYSTSDKDKEGSYFTIDLEQEVNVSDIDNIYVWYRSDVGGTWPENGGYEIRYAGEDEEYVSVATVTQEDFNSQRATAPFAVTTDLSGATGIEKVRYIQVFYPNAVAYGAQITEVAVFGKVPKEMIPTAPATPDGLINAPGEDNSLPYNFTWNAVEGASYYNIYVNDVLVGTSQTTSYNAYSYFVSATPGIYTVSVSAVEGRTMLESEKTSVEFEAKEVKPIVSGDGNYMANPYWNFYIGADWMWCNGTMSQEDGAVIGNFVTTGGGWDEAIWGITATSEKVVVEPNVTYTYSANITATKNMSIRIQVAGSDETIAVKANEPYTYKVDITPAENTIEVLYAMGGNETGAVTDVQFTISNHRVAVKTVEDVTTGGGNSTSETPTTTPTATTSKAPETTNKVTVAKAKVKSATKKKSAKKAKISLKKIKGAKYKVQISKAKKFNKKNILVKKTVKKATFTITSKKIKNKKKLYVRARAVNVVDGKSYTGKWSTPKKIKIKK